MKVNRVGEVHTNQFGNIFTIIQYYGNKNITIQFENGYIKTNVSYINIKNKKVSSPYDKTVCGIGYIGEGNAIITINNKICKSYSHWMNMLKRCYDFKLNDSRPTYKNCTVCDEWHSYNNFYLWYKDNYYEIEGEKMCLDKDILLKGNKIYSPNTCMFVPREINSLFTKSNATRGRYPIGVSKKKDNKLYISQLFENNKIVNMGYYNTPEEAFQVYKIEKEKYIKQVANEYKDKIPQKLYDAMYRYEVEITD